MSTTQNSLDQASFSASKKVSAKTSKAHKSSDASKDNKKNAKKPKDLKMSQETFNKQKLTQKEVNLAQKKRIGSLDSSNSKKAYIDSTKLTPRKTKSAKTILQVLPSLVSGGVERGVLEISKRLLDVGHRPIVASAGGPMLDRFSRFGIEHISLNVDTKNPYKIFANIALIKNLIDKYNVDVVHARSRAPAWSCHFACLDKPQTKFVSTFHGVYDTSSVVKKYYNSVMLKGTCVVAVSEFIKKHILEHYKVDANKIKVIHRGVDLEEFDPKNISNELQSSLYERYNIPKATPVLLLPGRVTRWKGHLVLIEALKKIKELDFYCIIVGDISKHPDFTKEVQEAIAAYKLKSKVQIFGNEPDMASLYSISDIVLSTSTEPEAFGRTIIEAQAMERIVIGTNIGGAAETITHNQTGYAVEPSDPDALAEQIKYCLLNLNSDLLNKIRTKSRSSVKKDFSLESMLNKTAALYDEF